ncbi:hypothetical protein Dda_6237 [Drechslerella dactyloides]|uniref:DH domain-containing protein n=1 Tax=Drechslerella dactyloides TaxID=74499 RepID=A0AAD6IVY5_DREDA|nr:hypothetical protein Dda_6237 [Drechslerella dactyloides]
MARVSPQMPNLGRNHQLYVSPPDPLLTQVVIFFLPYSGTSSRVDAHIYTACGFISYTRMTVDPSSAVYQAVNHMPVGKTESEIYRALAFALCRYFVELTVGVKGTASATARVARATKPEPFSAAHAGELAAKLVRIDDDSAISNILAALKTRFVPSMDIDLVLPPADAYNSKYQRLLQFMGDVHKQDTNLKRRPSRVERTRPKSVSALPRSNPEKVAIKLQELLDTEVKFIEKLQKLLAEVVTPERTIAEKAEPPEPNGSVLARLFPSYLDEIFQLNSRFLADLSKAMDDDNGVEGIADVFLRHFPSFHNPYSQYIALNPASSGLVGELMRSNTAFSQRMAGYGEQYLKSTLMEPIQRLPRYTLIIDGVLNNITVTSPVAPKLLEARDIVSKTCEMQSAPAQERAQTIARLSALISGWPANFKPGGALVTAVDLTEVAAPYTDMALRTNVIILVFADSIAFINRPSSSSMKAQGVLTEITMPPSIQHSVRREAADLHFAGCTSLKYNRYSTSDGGRAMWITLTKDLEEVYDMRESAVGMKKFLPSGPWEGKANELVEEIIQAQLQSKSRFQETRWSGNANSKFDSLELWTSVYEPQNYELEKSPSRALIQLGIEHPRFDTRTKTPEISATMNFVSTGKVRIDILDMGKIASTETVGELDILTVFTKRISAILEKHSQPSHPPISAAVIQGHRRIIRSLNLSLSDSDGHHTMRFKTFRPPSPVKLLHTFLGSSTINSPTKSPFKATSFESTSEMHRPTVLLERSHSVLYKTDGGGPVEDLSNRMKDINLVENHPQQGDSYHKQLERVLDAFVNVLEGKLAKEVTATWTYARRSSKSHSVDQLVRSMLTDSSQTATAQAASLDSVLTAFERFLVGKWREIMGTLLTQEALKDLQTKFETFHPDDFLQYFRNFLDNLGPQNKRAFYKVTKLFSHAIQHSTSDEAKTSLRSVFAEVLVASGLNSSKIGEVAKLHHELLLYMLYYVDISPTTLISKCAHEDNENMSYEPKTSPQRCYDYEEPYEKRKDTSPLRRGFSCRSPLRRNRTVKQKGSPSPTRGRSPFRRQAEAKYDEKYENKRDDDEDEEETSPSRMIDVPLSLLKNSWESTKRLATYSPTKSKFTDDSPFAMAAADASGLKRSKTTGTHAGMNALPTAVPLSSSSSLRKRFGLSTADGSDPGSGTTNGTSVSSSGSLSKSSVKSMLRQRSNKNVRDKDAPTSSIPSRAPATLHRSQSTETDVRRDYYERDSYRPMSGGGRERPAASTVPSSPVPMLTIPKTTPTGTPNALSPIVASPTVATAAAAEDSPTPALRRKKRRSSLSDLVAPKDLLDETKPETPPPSTANTATMTTTTSAPTPVQNSLSRASSIDRKENVNATAKAAPIPKPAGSMGPPPVPHHAKTMSTSSVQSRGGSGGAIPNIYSDKIAPLNVSGVRMSRAHSDASIASTASASTITSTITSNGMERERERDREPHKSSSGANGNTIPRTARLSTRLAGETQNVAKTSGSLEQELALISQELTRGAPTRKPAADANAGTITSPNGGGSTSSVPRASYAPDDPLRRRVRLLESKVNNTVSDLNRRYEALRDDSHAALANELRRNQEVERMWRDERNENDAVYKRFNEALEECVRGLKGRTDEERAGLVRMLVQAQEEVGRLRGEVSALKKENIDLRHGKLTEL